MKFFRLIVAIVLMATAISSCANSDLSAEILAPVMGPELLINQAKLLQVTIKTQDSKSGQFFVGLQTKTKRSWSLVTKLKKVLAPGKSEIKFIPKSVGAQKYRFAIWIDKDTSHSPLAFSAATNSKTYDITAERQKIWKYSIAFGTAYSDYQKIQETCFDENNSGNYYSFVMCLDELKVSYKKLSKSAITLAGKIDTVDVPTELDAFYQSQKSEILLIADNLNYIIETYCFNGVQNDSNIELLYACVGTDPSIGERYWNEVFDSVEYLVELRSEISAYLEARGLVFDLSANSELNS